MAKGNGSVAEKVRALIEEPVSSLGYGIWDVEFIKEGAEWHLVITIDSDEGISIDDCEKVHRFIDPILDEYDPVPGSYNLDVSSPGIERILRTREHFEMSVGERVSIKLFKPLNGVKRIEGTLVESNGQDAVCVEYDGGTVSIPFEQIAKANIVFDFEN